MKMKGKDKEKYYSIIIVSGATSTNKEFNISSKLIKNSIIAFSILLLIFGYIIFDYLRTEFDQEKMKRLAADNIKQGELIVSLNSKLKTIEVRLQKMADYKERILVAMGLTSPDALEEVGRGGGAIDTISVGTVTNTTQDVEFSEPTVINGQQEKAKLPVPSHDNILNRATEISDEAGKIEDTLKFVEDVMEKQKVRLASTPAVWPTKGYLTDPMGSRIHPLTGGRSYHSGQDIATQYGNKVVATADGVVLVAEFRDYYGNLMIIDHGFGFTTRYAHLASFNAKEGDRVKRSQVIGYVGNSGRSSAPHLHYEVRYFGKPQNPMNFILD